MFEASKRDFWFSIISILGALILALLIAEIGLRLNFKDVFISDPVLDILHESGGEYDSRGFRNPEALSQADIVALGDSQTEGNNAISTQAWPLVLGNIASTSVYSMGISGYGPVQYDALLPKALELHPKIVIVGFYFGNDLMDAERVVYILDAWKGLRDPVYVRPAISSDPSQDFRTILGSGVEPGSWQYWTLKVRTWVRVHSKLYALAGNATRHFREWIGVAVTKDQKQDLIRDVADQHPELAYVYDTDKNFETVLSPTYRLDTIDLDNPQTAEGWRITKDRLLDMQKQTEAAGAKLVIVLIPTKEKVYIDYMKHSGEGVPEVFGPYDAKETDLLTTVQKFCAQARLDCFPALPGMVGAMAAGTALYGTTNDGHPKAPGYRAIAESVFSYLTQNGLLP